MLSDTPRLETASNKIDFPASHEDTELLLGAMRQSKVIEVKDWTTAQRLLKICRQFDLNLVGCGIASQLGPMVEKAPLQIFAIASQFNNLPLARMALAKYAGIYGIAAHMDVMFSLRDLGDCTVPYLLAMARCLYICDQQNMCISEGEWKRAVSYFKPEVSGRMSRRACLVSSREVSRKSERPSRVIGHLASLHIHSFDHACRCRRMSPSVAAR